MTIAPTMSAASTAATMRVPMPAMSATPPRSSTSPTTIDEDVIEAMPESEREYLTSVFRDLHAGA